MQLADNTPAGRLQTGFLSMLRVGVIVAVLSKVVALLQLLLFLSRAAVYCCCIGRLFQW
jgi:hypothetical protein